MATTLRISEAATLALHASALIGSSPTRLAAREMAERLHVSEAHLAKVLQRLAHAGLLHSVRGPHGGFALAKPCREVTLLEVYEAVDGPLSDTSCLLGTPVCGGHCLLGDLLEQVNRLVRERLSQTTLCALADTSGEAAA